MILSNRHGPRQPPNPSPPAPRLLVMNALPTGTVTFLFSDVEGSTQLVRTAGGAYAGLIADVRRLLRSEIAERVGVSQVHVSRLLRSSLAALQRAAGDQAAS